MSGSVAFDRPIRLAVFFDYEISAGGAYQQAVNAALLVRQLPPELCEPVFVSTLQSSVNALRHYGIDAIYLPITTWRNKLLWLRSYVTHGRLINLVQRTFGLNSLDRFLEAHGIDLIYFTSPSELALLTEQFNYLFTMWDSCHRDELEFPEVRAAREFERREAFYQRALIKAVGIFVDSDLGRENIARRYGVDIGRAHVMSFSPAVGTTLIEKEYAAGNIDVGEKYGLRHDYIFYPAQFWAHKNHAYLLRGLHALEQCYGIQLAAIFSGGDKGNRKYIESVAKSLGLTDRVIFAGFVPDEEVPYLYRQSVALVMPTYFGPTNLPPLEAFSLGVPVLYSDLPGLRNHVGDAALLMNLSDPMSMAGQLHTLMTQSGLREELVSRGKRRVSSLTDQERQGILVRILARFRQRRICWANADSPSI